MTRIENPVGTDRVNQTHAFEIRPMFHGNHHECKNDAGFGEVLLQSRHCPAGGKIQAGNRSGVNDQPTNRRG